MTSSSPIAIPNIPGDPRAPYEPDFAKVVQKTKRQFEFEEKNLPHFPSARLPVAKPPPCAGQLREPFDIQFIRNAIVGEPFANMLHDGDGSQQDNAGPSAPATPLAQESGTEAVTPGSPIFKTQERAELKFECKGLQQELDVTNKELKDQVSEAKMSTRRIRLLEDRLLELDVTKKLNEDLNIDLNNVTKTADQRQQELLDVRKDLDESHQKSSLFEDRLEHCDTKLRELEGSVVSLKDTTAIQQREIKDKSDVIRKLENDVMELEVSRSRGGNGGQTHYHGDGEQLHAAQIEIRMANHKLAGEQKKLKELEVLFNEQKKQLMQKQGQLLQCAKGEGLARSSAVQVGASASASASQPRQDSDAENHQDTGRYGFQTSERARKIQIKQTPPA